MYRAQLRLAGWAGLSPVGTAAQYYPQLAEAVEPMVVLTPQLWFDLKV
jgi:hypothetical protein